MPRGVHIIHSLLQPAALPRRLQVYLLFRDASGAVACIKDQCAHRACPLSSGKIVDGCAQCPYHGWQYDGAGGCVSMPSTVFQQVRPQGCWGGCACSAGYCAGYARCL